MNKSRVMLVALLLVALLGAAGYYYWQQQQTPPPPPPASAPVAGPVTPLAPPPPPPAPVAPVIQHPVQAIETPAPAAPRPLPPLAESDTFVRGELTDWLGRKDVRSFLQLDDFVRRVVATVDNLGLEQAPASRWPVQTTPGRFTTLPAADGGAVEVISPDNDRRYTAFVLFIESINLNQAVQLYVRLYPLFQQAYEELGYPKKHFNDRLVEVIDQLLATPVPNGPVGVSLVEVKGPIPSERPWLRYEYSDPALEAMNAGPKILVRTGPVNQRRLQNRLLQLRRLLTKAPLPAAVR